MEDYCADENIIKSTTNDEDNFCDFNTSVLRDKRKQTQEFIINFRTFMHYNLAESDTNTIQMNSEISINALSSIINSNL